MKAPLILLVLATGLVDAQAADFDLLHKAWPAHWIAPPDVSLQNYGVYHFRKSFDLATVPARFVVHVSGDNRYQLFVNGKRVAWGPARGDLTHWRYETVDIASSLRAGKNTLAAVVWNDGEFRAIAQVTNETGFILQVDSPEQQQVNTDKTWRVLIDNAYSPVPIPPDQITGYHAVGPNEKVVAQQYPWGWEQPDFDDSRWSAARQLSSGGPRDSRDAPNRWMLVPREIPAMEESPDQKWTLRESNIKPWHTEGIAPVPPVVSESIFPLTVPPGMSARLLLDRGELTTAFPELIITGGAGDSQVRIRYAETLYIRKGEKGNRNDVKDKQFFGYIDTFVTDGGAHRRYAPLFWRTYRYVELLVDATSGPLTIESFHSIVTGYPFQAKAQFETSNAAAQHDVSQILSTGFHTARLCAHETYMDCPYYEQLQYAGDARIQMMVSLYMTGDARLMKNGIALLDSSRTAEGATLSRAPSYLQQYIPPFSLWWIGMLHDYWMYVDDESFVREMLPGVHAVLSFYSKYQKPNGSLNQMPWWNYVDWVKSWPDGEAPAEADGSSAAALDLQLLLAYDWAAELESHFGNRGLAEEYRQRREQLRSIILSTDWDAPRGLFADQPSHRTYSQQVNTLAVLAHLQKPDISRSILEKTLSDASLAPASIYFRAYVNAALREVGLGDQYLAQLAPWRTMLTQGLTTWAEWSGTDSRSDCHAWGASPNFEIYRTVAGIDTAAPGFKRVRIEPNLGPLTDLHVTVPHPRGTIDEVLKKDGSAVKVTVTLPLGTEGDFVWLGRPYPLHTGMNQLSVPK